jgi:hypothetical protein
VRILPRRLKGWELVGWLVYAVAALAAFAALRLGGPKWVVDTAFGVAFLLVIPLAFLTLRGKWRGD